MPVDRRISDIRVEMGGLDDANLRPRLKRRRSDIYPMRAVVVRSPDEAVIGADPDQAVANGRRPDVIDHPAPRSLRRGVLGRRGIEGRRNARISAGQVWADRSPGLAAVAGAEQPLVAEIERVIAL